MKMVKYEKKKVTKRTYHMSNFIVHSLCLSGLIWQITQISVRFFAFDVTRSTNVALPEEITSGKKVLYLCFENTEYMNVSLYEKLLEEKLRDGKMTRSDFLKRNTAIYRRKIMATLTVSERFRISPSSKDIKISGNVTDFIIGTKYCIQLQDVKLLIIYKARLPNATLFGLVKGPVLPHFDYGRIHTVGNLENRGQRVDFGISSSTFTITKLPFPYTDRCENYNRSALLSTRRLVIENCINEKFIAKYHKLSKYHVCKFDDKHNNYSIDDRFLPDKTCYSKHNSPDCMEKIYLTTSEEPRFFDATVPVIIFTDALGKDPSFFISSKASIDNIDFLTYVLGALGAWIGFSFTSINPIPFIFQVNEDFSIKNRLKNDGTLIKEVIKHRHKIISVEERVVTERSERLLSNQKLEQLFISLYQKFENEKCDCKCKESYDAISTAVH